MTKNSQRGFKSPMPEKIKPMLATLIDKPFDSPEWIYEIKWDGYRALAHVEGQNIKLYSRNYLSFNTRYSPIVDDLKILHVHAIFDGEIVVFNDQNQASFQTLQNYQKTKKGKLVYEVFDLLYLEGYDLREVPLIERKELLKKVLIKSSHLQYCDHAERSGIKFFQKVSEIGFEGMIAKEKSSLYTETRSHNWLKVKTHLQQEAIICGFTAPQGARDYFGSLVLGAYDQGQLVYVGHTGSGFDHRTLAEVHKKLEPLIQSRCPFKNTTVKFSETTWVKPHLVCEITFAEWTMEGLMRQAIFQGLRIDKKAKEVFKEKVSNEKS